MKGKRGEIGERGERRREERKERRFQATGQGNLCKLEERLVVLKFSSFPPMLTVQEISYVLFFFFLVN